MTIGAFAGVIRSSTPALFALASGIQWFTLGTSFWGMRFLAVMVIFADIENRI